MKIKINCIICNKEIENPIINRVICRSRRCNRIYHKIYAQVWNILNTDKIKMYYQKQKEKKNESQKN